MSVIITEILLITHSKLLQKKWFSAMTFYALHKWLEKRFAIKIFTKR